MIINYLNICRSCCRPAEADAELIVHPDAVLPFPVASERFETVARWHTEILQSGGNLKLTQLAPCNFLDSPKPLYPLPGSERLRIGVPERYDHSDMITQRVLNVSRHYP